MKISALALDNLDLLHELGEHPAPAAADLARTLERDLSNLSKTVKRLREDGVVADGELSLTDAGRAATRLFARDGEVLADDATLLLRHDQLEPDPNNARSDYDHFAINALREDIVARSRPGRVGLLHALTVLAPARSGGLWRIKGGFRRWEAIGRAISVGELAVGAPIPCVRHDGLSDLDAAVMALVENVQREDLHPLDEGLAYARLVGGFGLDEGAIAEAVKKSRKHVQDRIALTEKLDADAQRRMRLPAADDNHLSYTAARRLMQEQNARPRPAVEASPKEALTLMELADRCAARPSHDPSHPGKSGWTRIAGAPAGGAASSLVAKGLIEIAEPDHGAHAYARLAEARARAVAEWIADKGPMAMWSARAEVLGTGISAELERSRRYATDWLNDPLPAVPPLHGEGSQSERVGESAGGGPLRDDRPPIHNDPGAPDSPTPSAHADIPPLHGEGATAENIPPFLQRLAGVPAEDKPAFPTLTPAQSRTLNDVAAKIAFDPKPGPAGAYTGAVAYEFHRDGDAQILIQHRLIKIAPDAARKGFLVCLTPLGEAWMQEQLVGDYSGVPPYATAWLNPAIPDGGAAPIRDPAPPIDAAAGVPAAFTAWAHPVIEPPAVITCGHCERDFEISRDFDDQAEIEGPAHLFVAVTEDELAECPHCQTRLKIARVEVRFVSSEGAEL